ncbi:hypothetical protein OKW50_005833 [Paraburkholderia youngii]|uniref:hypothetical protein n=2 Tax=Paraburkholderia youngii TaxID=2782701 RepID=UPI0020CDA3E5|nr:hypothetical protein [Paraburkholderia youngii]
MDWDNRKMATRLIVAAVAAWMPLAHGKVCTGNDAAAADAMVDHLHSWAQINSAFSKYGQCDDGGIAEGYSEAIARLLIDHWKALPELDKQIKLNPPLELFVRRHINSTLETDDLAKIITLSTRSCPKGISPLCKALANAASQAEQ